MDPFPAPLCDAGRCAQLLAGLAEARARLVATQGDRIVEVLSAVLADPEFGATDAQRQVLPALLTRAVAELGGAA